LALIALIARVQLVVAMTALLTMCVVTVSDVFLKYVFSRPIAGAYDLVESLLPVVVFYGLPTMLLRRQSIVIDLVDHAMQSRWVEVLKTISDVVVLGLLIAVALAFISPAWQAFDYGDRKIELGLPLSVVWAVVVVGTWGGIAAAVTNVWQGVWLRRSANS
jgi:TRAP-type C4-dicarboxylate transport system permease small subunit